MNIFLPLPKIPLPLRLLVSGHQVTVDPQRLWMVTIITMNMVNMVSYHTYLLKVLSRLYWIKA